MRGSSPIVLIVEDEWLVRDAIVQTFRDAGWKVLRASSGEAAITLLNANGRHIDALFTDIQLHGCLSGWDVADAFTVSHPDAAVLYTSGNGNDLGRQLRG